MIPKSATHYMSHTYYKTGNHYTWYFANGVWRESGSVTNKDLDDKAVKITESEQ